MKNKAGTQFAGKYELTKRNRNEEENLSRKQRIPWTKAIINLEENKFFSHTPAEWAKLIIFYIFFFTILGVIWLTYYVVMLNLLPEDEPMIQRSEPTLVFAPYNKQRQIIFKEYSYNDIADYVNNIDDFLNKEIISDEEQEKYFKECHVDNAYGYKFHTPCIFIKFSRIRNFVAKTYKTDIPEACLMQADSNLLDIISKSTNENRIWLTCKVTNRKNSRITFRYIPNPYWEANGLFDMSKKNGHQRIIALKIEHLKFRDNVNIKCTAWAQNIEVDKSTHGKGWISVKVIVNVLRTNSTFP